MVPLRLAGMIGARAAAFPAPCRPCPPPLRRRLAPAAAASAGPTGSGDEPLAEQPLAGASPVLEVERQTERALAYGGIAGAIGGAGIAAAVAPTWVVQFVWAACPSPLVASLARVSGSLLLLAAVCAHCLKEAAEHDRLRSETYQRLNLALLWWGLGTGLVLWLAPLQPVRLALGLCTALVGATSAHAALTYQETSDEGLNPFHLVRRFLSSLGNLSSYKNTESSSLLSMYAYGLSAKAAIAAGATILLEGRLKLMQEGLMTVPLGPLGSSVALVNGVGYALLAVVLFTLKDAAARGRLGASTFRALNIGVGVVGLTNTINIAAGIQAGWIVGSRVAAGKLAFLSVMTSVALYNYFFAKK